VVDRILQRAKLQNKARILPIGALTWQLLGEGISEMFALKKAGCIGASNGEKNLPNALVMQRAMEYAATHDMTIFLHARDPFLGKNGFMHRGEISTRMGIPAIPESAETTIVARELILIEQTGVRAHFNKITSAKAVSMIKQAQQQGLNVTVDVTAHHLYLTHTDVDGFNALCHVQPPLRSWHDREMLRHALADNTISAICSDHQPHEEDAKLAPFPETEAGISGLETLLPITMKLVDENCLTLEQGIERLTWGPAQIANPDLGHLSIGAHADVCVFLPHSPWVLTKQSMLSQGKNNPFLNWEFNASVTHTLLEGNITYGK
jgi:dihydroorotase